MVFTRKCALIRALKFSEEVYACPCVVEVREFAAFGEFNTNLQVLSVRLSIEIDERFGFRIKVKLCIEIERGVFLGSRFVKLSNLVDYAYFGVIFVKAGAELGGR